MGGKAFVTAKGDEPALRVPRMNPDLYTELKNGYIKKLSALFRLVACPTEAPGKEDYGDIDIVVADPDKRLFQSVWSEMPLESRIKSSEPKDAEIRKDVLMFILDAKRYLHNGNSQSFAVPHPILADAYVQVDLNLQPVELHGWHVFHQSHGDLWNILGTSVRAFGLTPSEQGLFVRDPDIEKLDKKRARVFLSRDPVNVLELMNLDMDQWNKGWPTELEMFRYAIGCKFFTPKLYRHRSQLKLNDRQRMEKRPCFRRFVEEQIECDKSDDHEGTWLEIDRNSALEEVLSRFRARERYEENHRKWFDEQEALRLKREGKAERRAAHMAAQKSYGGNTQRSAEPGASRSGIGVFVTRR